MKGCVMIVRVGDGLELGLGHSVGSAILYVLRRAEYPVSGPSLAGVFAWFWRSSWTTVPTERVDDGSQDLDLMCGLSHVEGNKWLPTDLFGATPRADVGTRERVWFA